MKLSANLYYDFKRMLGKSKLRVLNVLISRAFIGVLQYRMERSLYAVFGKLYSIVRIFLLPILMFLRAYSNCDIHYKANIGKGIRILHPSLGLVISGKVTIGNNPIFVGGNCVGINKPNKKKDFNIGNSLEMGANAVIIGPLKLGDKVVIGASACVVKSFIDNAILVGNPAKNISKL